MIILCIPLKERTLRIKCASITEAYDQYVKTWSTLGEWLYYLRVAHTLLNHVHDEEVMACIFRNVFDGWVESGEG